MSYQQVRLQVEGCLTVFLFVFFFHITTSALFPPLTHIHAVSFPSSLAPCNSIAALKVLNVSVPALEHIQSVYTVYLLISI